MTYRDRYPLGVLDVSLDQRPDDIEMAGRNGVYRAGFVSMAVPGLPDEIQVGRVTVNQTIGPVFTQRTEVTQRPEIAETPRVAYVFDKRRTRDVSVSDGFPLTVCELPVLIEDQLQLDSWRREVYGALGLLVAVLDERIARAAAFEDLIVFGRDGEDEVVAVVDALQRLRHFLPFRVGAAERKAVHELGDEPDASAAFAGRWYLRAAQAGPTPDSIIFFWIALEALVANRPGTSVPRKVEDALGRVGIEPSDLSPRLGPLYGVRASIVHEGDEPDERIREAYYMLEQTTRLLLKVQLGLTEPGGWPIHPGNQTFLPPRQRDLVKQARANPWLTHWR